MRLPTERVTPRAITASALKLTRPESDYSKRLKEPWQERTFYYNDIIGELNYAANFYARQLQAIRLFPATLSDNGDLEPIESGLPVELLDRIQDPGGGRGEIQFNYGRLMFLPGEGVLFGSSLETDDEKWRFLWREEVKIDDDGTAVRLNAQRQPTSETGVAYRFWTPHPKHSDMATSPTRSVLKVLAELDLLTDSVMSTTVTRLTNGILALAAQLSPPPSAPGHDEDPEQNPFLSDLMDHMQAQIENPGTPEAAMPFLLEGDYDYLKNGEGVQWIKLHDPATDFMERDLRTEAIKRLALGLDMPPEALLGMTDANHWTAKQVEYDKRVHVEPLASRFARDLNDAYLRPALVKAEFSDARQVVIAVDHSQNALSADSSAQADAAADRGMISDVGYRALTGIPEKFKPSKEEKDAWFATKLRDPQLIDPALAPLGGQPGPPQPPAQNGNVADGPPAPTKQRAVTRQEARTAAVLGAASMALRHCRARAGARLRRHTRACDDCQPAIDGKPNSVVAAALGDKIVGGYVRDPLELVQGGADEFRAELADLGFIASAADVLVQRLELHAAASLFEQEPGLPAGFASIIEEVSFDAAAA